MSNPKTPEELDRYLEDAVKALDKVTTYVPKRGRPKTNYAGANQLSLEL